jgi:hypothetical protein
VHSQWWKRSSPPYSTAAAPASSANDIKLAESRVAGDGRQGCTPLAAANVVANCAVGFGPPLMVTVGLDGKAWSEALLEPEATMENNGEVAYRTPCVLLMKRKE